MKLAIKILLGAVILVALVVVSAIGFLRFGLPNVDDAPDLKIEPTEELLARGEHLVKNVMACLDCHSQRDYTYFAPPSMTGTLGAGGEKWAPQFGFPGTLYSPNITPFHLGSWTDGEIYRALTTGVTKEGRALFPIMPYSAYGQLDDRDIHAVIAYIRTLPSIESEFPERKLDFPLNLLVNTMPTQQTEKLTRPEPSDIVGFGRYLTKAASCSHCHTAEVNGQPVMSEYMAGGFEYQLPTGLKIQSSNITPDTLTGIGLWTEDAFIDKFHSFRDLPVSKVPEKGFNTIMPWRVYAGMSREELSAIYHYLRSLEPVHKEIPDYTYVE